jgi:CRP/FNR family cyclic AMP-dependent transcriptional regulator
MDDSALGRVYADGEIVVQQGEVGDCMFTIQEGRLEVLAFQEGRGDVRVGIMEKGAIFGEMAIFEREVRSATVRALGEARVLTIDKKTFLRRVQEDPSLAFNLLRNMSQRIRRLTAQVGDRRRGTERRVTGDRHQVDRRARS